MRKVSKTYFSLHDVNIALKSLADYLIAIQKRKTSSIKKLVPHDCLIEIPFLQPGRFSGVAEIIDAHDTLFGRIRSLDIRLGCIKTSANHALAGGQMEIVGYDETPRVFPIAIAVATDGAILRRISIYCREQSLGLH